MSPDRARPASGVSAVVLAAGESRRMGDRNKLLLTVAGEPLLRRTVRTLLASSLQEIVVVLGHQADSVRPLLDGLDVSVVLNEHYTEGQMTSVHAGLAALSDPGDGVMVCLGDQPLLTVEDVADLIRAFRQRTGGSILVPLHQGKRGNPVILATVHCDEILRGNRNLGCRKLIEKNPDLVTTVDMATDHVIVDLDTPDDHLLVERRLQEQEPLST